ncbi:MAG TPA: hypothetical protein VF997_13420 [Polyangia bacterium]
MRQLLCVLALALPPFAVGCGGTYAGAMSDGGSGDGGGNLALFAACTDNSQCGSGLCTQVSYDRSPTPICTYQCDASNMNPMCPMGCNPKGYCRKPM